MSDIDTRPPAAAEAETLAGLAAALDVPVLAGPQAQGDLVVIPASGGIVAPATRILPKGGVAVVRGENGGHTHALLADGPAFWEPGQAGSQTLGTVTVPEGTTAWLEHPEHGQSGIAPGTYVIRRQREQADEVRLVAD